MLTSLSTLNLFDIEIDNSCPINLSVGSISFQNTVTDGMFLGRDTLKHYKW